MQNRTTNAPVEHFLFRIPGYGLDHQTGAIVNLLVDLGFKEHIGASNPYDYPEFVSIVNAIKGYLLEYPNEVDFWEILNKNLVTALLTQTIPTVFGVEYHLEQVVDSLKVALEVRPGSSLVNFPRASVVTGSPLSGGGIDFDQSFSFAIPDYGLDHQGGAIVDILVNLDFKEDIALTNPYEYPEFVSIVNFIKNYLVSYPNETDFWEILNKNLVTALLTQTIPTTFGVEYHLQEVVDALSVDIKVEAGSSLVNYPRESEVKGSPVSGGGIDFDQSFSFAIPDYGLDHQNGAIVDIMVDLDFKENIALNDPFEYPEFVSIVNFIKNYLVNYPNEGDFWEILNKNLVTALLTETIPTTFGVEYHLEEVVDALTVDIQVEQGSSLVNYPRSSKVTGSPLGGDGIDFDQSFAFSILDYGLDHQGGAIVDLHVDLQFKEDIGLENPFDYPEFVSVVNYIKNYLVTYPNEIDFWEVVNKNLARSLMTETIPTTFGVEYHLQDVVDSLAVDIEVKSGSSLVNYPRASSVVQGSVVDAVVTLEIPQLAVREDGDNNLIYTFKRIGDLRESLSVGYNVAGTATLGSDYSGISALAGSISFAAGSPTATLSLNPAADLEEESGETVTVTLAGGAGYTVGTATALTVTIQNDDVSSARNYRLAAGDSSLVLVGNNPIQAIGNELDNTIIGNARANTIYGLQGADTLTGGGSRDRDTFAYRSLAESRLGEGGSFDQITDYRRIDRIVAPPQVLASRLFRSLGEASEAEAAAIADVLTPARFRANAAAAFTVDGQIGTFVALNDHRAGYQAESDAIVFLQNYQINALNSVAVV